VSVIQYYDNTSYYNILADLPCSIIETKYLGKLPETTLTVNDEEIISAWSFTSSNMVTGLYNNEIKYGVVSTINDDWGIMIPSSLYIKTGEFQDVKNNKVLSSYIKILTSSDTEVFIPEGTIVSSIVPPGSIIEDTVYVDKYEDVYGLCSEFITEYNQKYWLRDFTYETVDSPKIQNEILYYEQYFDVLKNAQTKEQKFEIYKNEVYPSLTKVW
jgi:hypothetical protein